jgi:hypothetical protein
MHYTHWDRFPSQDQEVLGALHHEAGEFMTQDAFDFVNLFDLDADAN